MDVADLGPDREETEGSRLPFARTCETGSKGITDGGQDLLCSPHRPYSAVTPDLDIDYLDFHRERPLPDPRTGFSQV